MDWNHVIAPASGEILRQGWPPTHLQLAQAWAEMNGALGDDVGNEDVSHRAITARSRALEDFESVMLADNDVLDDAGEVTGNAGIDKLAAVSAMRRFWSDGEIS